MNRKQFSIDRVLFVIILSYISKQKYKTELRGDGDVHLVVYRRASLRRVGGAAAATEADGEGGNGQGRRWAVGQGGAVGRRLVDRMGRARAPSSHLLTYIRWKWNDRG